MIMFIDAKGTQISGIHTLFLTKIAHFIVNYGQLQ